MAEEQRSKLVRIFIRNLGSIGNEGLEIELNNIVCLVGKNNSGKTTVLRGYELAQGNRKLETGEKCVWAEPETPTEVILDVHIPKNIPNVGNEWKFKDAASTGQRNTCVKSLCWRFKL